MHRFKTIESIKKNNLKKKDADRCEKNPLE
jgi:hypothetical protein